MTSINSDFAPVRLSSDDFPIGDRLDATREVYGRAILKLDLDPLPDSRLHIDATLRALPALSVAAGLCSPVCCRHTSELIDSDDLILSVALAGAGTMKQRGREIAVGEGEAILTASDEPGVHTYHAASRFVVFRLPRGIVAPLVADITSTLLRPVPRDSEALWLLVSYVGVLKDMTALATPELRHLAASHMHDLAALALGATRDAAETARGRGVRAARLRAIKADIIGNLGRHGLSADEVAARHRISGRYLRKLFAMEDASFSAFVLEQRIGRAHRLLIDPRFDDRAVSTIAYEVGFGDLSYFNRVFRRRYGASPSDVRQAARRAR